MVLVAFVFVVLTIIFSIDLKISQATSHVTFHDLSIADYHQQWMAQFSRVYSNESEKQMRFEIFKKNVKLIENSNNKGNQNYKLGVNEFTDLTDEEFFATHTGLKDINLTSQSKVVDETMPSWNWNVSNIIEESKDWRIEGAVTPIKSQGACGCCWAFSTVAAVEGLTKIANGNLVSLSEQQLLDCDIGYNKGCNGGTMSEAFKYIAENGGIASEDQYPYELKEGSCRSQLANPAMQITGFQAVPSNNEAALLEAVSRQPVSVSISVRGNLRHYLEGVYSEPDCGIAVNHGVTLVGYGTSEDGTKYWLVKNSWGPSWGENGYLRLHRDVEWPQGMCGLAQWASYPVA